MAPDRLRLLLLPIGLATFVVALSSAATDWGLYRGAGLLLGATFTLLGAAAALRMVVGAHAEADLWFAAGWLILIVGAAVFADVLPFAEAQDASKTLTEPSRATPSLFSAHPFGTDSQALDILGGVVYGARVSLQVSLLAVVIGTVIGGLLGIASGYFGGKLDAVVGILTDSMLAFPPLIMLLAVVTAFDPNVLTIALALALLGIPTYTRLARANTLTLVNREFIMAARALGAGDGRIIMRELLPNVLRPLLSFSFIIVAVLIVAEASLSFLGVGIQRPTPSWGNMISAGQGELRTAPHLVFVPAVVMFLTVFALNRIGDRARELWDPRDSAL